MRRFSSHYLLGIFCHGADMSPTNLHLMLLGWFLITHTHRFLSFSLCELIHPERLCVSLVTHSRSVEKTSRHWQVEWDCDCSPLQLFTPLPLQPPSSDLLLSTKTPTGSGGGCLPSCMRLAGKKGYWTAEEWQARRREGEEKQTISVVPGAYGLARGSQLLSSHPANHATADTSCSGDVSGLDGSYMLWSFIFSLWQKPKERVQWIQRSSCELEE